MKKMLLVLFSTIFLFGCSSPSSNNTPNTPVLPVSFNPPSWIQGRWLVDNFSGYKFTSNDYIVLSPPSEYSIGTQITNVNNIGGVATIIEEIKTSTEYKGVYTMQSITQHFHFVKISSTQFKDALNDPNGGTPYIKQ